MAMGIRGLVHACKGWGMSALWIEEEDGVWESQKESCIGGHRVPRKTGHVKAMMRPDLP